MSAVARLWSMRRRDFLRGGGALAASLALGARESLRARGRRRRLERRSGPPPSAGGERHPLPDQGLAARQARRGCRRCASAASRSPGVMTRHATACSGASTPPALEPTTSYELDLRAGAERLCDPWTLGTFPPRDSKPDRFRLLVYTCAGGNGEARTADGDAGVRPARRAPAPAAARALVPAAGGGGERRPRLLGPARGPVGAHPDEHRDRGQARRQGVPPRAAGARHRERGAARSRGVAADRGPLRHAAALDAGLLPPGRSRLLRERPRRRHHRHVPARSVHARARARDPEALLPRVPARRRPPRRARRRQRGRIARRASPRRSARCATAVWSKRCCGTAGASSRWRVRRADSCRARPKPGCSPAWRRRDRGAARGADAVDAGGLERRQVGRVVPRPARGERQARRHQEEALLAGRLEPPARSPARSRASRWIASRCS